MTRVEKCRLDSIAKLWYKGQPFKKNDIVDSGVWPCIHYGELFSKYGAVIEKVSSKCDVAPKILSRKGDILFPSSDVTPAGLARCSTIVQEGVIVGGDVIGLRPVSGLNPVYLSYAIRHQRQQLLQRVTGALIKHISAKSLRSVLIPIHPIEIQNRFEKIVRLLNHVIEYRRTQLTRLDSLVKARFVEMFGDFVENPRNWRVEELGDYIVFMTSGPRGWSKYFSDAGEYFLTIRNVKGCNVFTENIQHVRCPNNAEADRAKVKEGDLLISITADLGRTGVVSEQIANHGTYINQHLMCVRLMKEMLHPVYVAHLLESEGGRLQFSQKKQSAVKAGLNYESIRTLKIMVPPMHLQLAFVAFITQVDKSKVVVQLSQKRIDVLHLLW